jgi:hypothetical protein
VIGRLGASSAMSAAGQRGHSSHAISKMAPAIPPADTATGSHNTLRLRRGSGLCAYRP